MHINVRTGGHRSVNTNEHLICEFTQMTFVAVGSSHVQTRTRACTPFFNFELCRYSTRSCAAQQCTRTFSGGVFWSWTCFTVKWVQALDLYLEPKWRVQFTELTYCDHVKKIWVCACLQASKITSSCRSVVWSLCNLQIYHAQNTVIFLL